LKTPLLFSFAVENAIRRVQVRWNGLKFKSTHQLLVSADVDILGGSVRTIKKNAEALVLVSMEVGL
jgi:hypothetical protein